MTVVTSRPSRACVHSAAIVYIALPSASRHQTGRSGQAIAAPVAAGRPYPIAPPVSVSQSWRGAPAVAAGSPTPEVADSSTTTAPSGSSAPTTAAALPTVSAPVGSSGRPDRARVGGVSPATRSASSSAAAAAWLYLGATSYTVQPSGTRSPGLSG